jgi:hypothetical protein
MWQGFGKHAHEMDGVVAVNSILDLLVDLSSDLAGVRSRLYFFRLLDGTQGQYLSVSAVD